jgi:hypothetical protein
VRIKEESAEAYRAEDISARVVSSILVQFFSQAVEITCQRVRSTREGGPLTFWIKLYPTPLFRWVSRTQRWDKIPMGLWDWEETEEMRREEDEEVTWGEIFRAMHPTKAPFLRSNGERGEGRSEESFGGSETQKYVFSVSVSASADELREEGENEGGRRRELRHDIWKDDLIFWEHFLT